MPFTLVGFSEFPGGPPISIVGNKEDFESKEDFLKRVDFEYGECFGDLEPRIEDVEETYCRYSPAGIEDWNEGCYVLSSKGGKGAFEVYNIEC